MYNCINVHHENYINCLFIFRPFILDPANPFNNVCSKKDWDEVARMARLSLGSPLMSCVC